ncbi:MAG: hypothetical protein WBW81_05315 [Methylocella sp.]
MSPATCSCVTEPDEEYFASGSFDAETAYWKNNLAGASYFEIVPDHERPGHLTYGGEILAAILPPELGSKLEETARKRNLTLFSFGCAVTASSQLSVLFPSVRRLQHIQCTTTFNQAFDASTVPDRSA